jgi:two-component system, sensor histidine kinase and response regulator
MDEIYVNRDLQTASEISVYQLVNALTDAAFICDHSGRILVCSDQVLPFFGLSDKKRITGSSIQSFFAYESIEEAYFLLSNAVSEPNGRKTGRLLVKKGLKDTINAAITFASIVSSDFSTGYVLVTFREAPFTDSGVVLLHNKDARLARLCETVLSYSGSAPGKIWNLLSQIGETLGAVSCSYSKHINGLLQPSASWESPFTAGIPAQLCSRQVFDYLKDQNEKITLIRKPLLDTFLESESLNSEDSGVKAILGFTVINNNVIDGLISAVFTFDYTSSEIDKQFIKTIAAILENEGLDEVRDTSPVEVSFRQLIDCFSDPVYILSPEGIIMEVNKGVVKFYGYEREELIGQTPMLLSAEGKNDTELIQKLFVKAFQGEPQKFEWWGKRKNGEIFPKEVMFNKSKYYDHDVVIAIGRDLTESKKVESELLRYNLELEESNVSKDKFFGILAHDLKNPFQGLLGFIDLLYEDLDELSNTQIKEYLSNVRNASYHTYALLENLLEWSRIQSGKMPFTPSAFNIRDEINSVISILDTNANRKGIRLINEVDQNLVVEADRNMIHSVLQNLITNSIKFSNSRGEVFIRGRVQLSSPENENITKPIGTKWLEISITDNGIGIPEEILPRLFKLNGQYSQAGTANEPGTGLGLVICHEMVEKNGGRIWAESVAGEGSSFIFTIPLVD